MLRDVCMCNICCGFKHTQHLRGAIRLETHPASTYLISILMGTDHFHTVLSQTPALKKHFLHNWPFICLCVSQSFPRWEKDSKISCEQTLQKGEGPKTSWTRELTNDGELILVRLSGHDISGLCV